MKTGLPLIAPKDARLFILGSLPGDASLAAQRYYAHPTNQFWRLLGQAIGEDLQAMGYEERLACLAGRQVGLWDVIAAASRTGSLDQAIRDPELNPVRLLLETYPDLSAIAFNGATAARIGVRMLDDAPRPVHVITLPSSSAANTAPFADKARVWAKLADWAGAKPLRQA